MNKRPNDGKRKKKAKKKGPAKKTRAPKRKKGRPGDDKAKGPKQQKGGHRKRESAADLTLQLGAHEFHLPDCPELTLTFPVVENGRRLFVSAEIKPVPDESILFHYNCGDILSGDAIPVADGGCDASIAYQIGAKVMCEESTFVKTHSVCCQEHSLVVTLQAAFFAGAALGQANGQ